MATLSVAIMAHRSRSAIVPEILEQLGHPAEVVWDRFGDRWETGKRAWQARDAAATHHLVLQDDVYLCRDLVAGLERAAAAVPDAPVCLYTSGRVLGRNSQTAQDFARAALATGRSWFCAAGPWWGPGIMLPAGDIDTMIAWVERNAQARPNYDWRIGEYYAWRGVECHYTVPSLVEHRDVPSIVRAGAADQGLGRTAFNFLGADSSALSVDWSALPPPPAPELPPVHFILPATHRALKGASMGQIATRRVYGRDRHGRVVLIAAPGHPLPPGVEDPVEARDESSAPADPTPASDLAGGPAEGAVATAPPKVGKGSGRDAWAAYAAELGIAADDLTRQEIIEAIERRDG